MSAAELLEGEMLARALDVLERVTIHELETGEDDEVDLCEVASS